MPSPFRSIALAARSLSRRPGFTAVVVATIALAIAANTAIFSVVQGTLIRPLPFAAPERLVSVEARAYTGFQISTSIPNFRDWRDRNHSFESFAGSAPWSLRLTGRGPAEIVEGRALVGDLFGTLGLTPEIGRLIPAAEAPDHAGGAAVVVLGHAFWQSRFGGDPAILGQTLRLDQMNYQVVGVLPAEVGFPDPGVEVYFPMGSLGDIPWDDRDSGFGMSGVARLRPGAALAAARLDMERVNREVGALVGKSASKAELTSLTNWYVGETGAQLWILMGAVGFVLLIAIANVGNLLLARGEDRYRELALRAALGAGRNRLAGLLLLESLLLAGTGGILGALLAWVAVGALVPLLPSDIPAIMRAQIGMNPAVLLFSVGLALATGVLFGLAPALRARGVQLADAFKGGGRSTDGSRSRLRSTLVVVEVALALVLLVSAGLMLRSLDRLLHVDKGFDATNVLTAAVSPSPARGLNPEEWRAYYDGLRTRAAALPGVQSASLQLLLPLAIRSWELRIFPEGAPIVKENGQSVLYNVVSPEYFGTFSVPILRGRGFGPADREGAVPVAIIDETMAERFWPHDDPIGKRVAFEFAGENDTGAPIYRTVIGVAKNVRHYQLIAPSRIQVYVPVDQSGRRTGMTLRLAMRTAGPPEHAVAGLRALVAGLDPDAMVYQARPLEDYVDQASARSRAMTRVLAAFGAGALALAALGIFGVMSYAVTRRQREIGIRIALGAAPRDVMRWVGGRALGLTAAGLAGGAVAAVFLTRLLRTILFEVAPLDPAIYLGVVLLLGLTALLAAWLPARRAMRVDPVGVMKEEG